MANSKRKEKETTGEKFVRLFVNIFANGIAILALVFAYAVPQPCDGIDNIYLYCRVHPTTFFDIIGWVGFCFCCFWLSGVYKYFIDPANDDAPYLKTLNWVAGIAGFVGVILIWNL